MDTTTSDSETAPPLAFDGAAASSPAAARGVAGVSHDPSRVLVVSNPRSHRNRQRGALPLPDGIVVEEPKTREELRDVLARHARRGLDLVVIAGGDGTVRDVLSRGGDLWADKGPDIAFLPRGKTNALALDVGMPDDWEVADAIAAWRQDRVSPRSPIEITSYDASSSDPVRGFLFGAGTFVDATDLAQGTHRMGAFNNLAVGLSMGLVMGKVLFGGNHTRWRTGYRMDIAFPAEARAVHGSLGEGEGNRFLAFVSTMENMPFGMTPFGPSRPGMKVLLIDAPPRRFATTAVKIARGHMGKDMERRGVFRIDTPAMSIDLDGGFVLDGERFDAGRYSLREGAPIGFVRK